MISSALRSAPSRELSLGQMVGHALMEHGISDLFCIPGDFTMQLSRELLEVDGLTLRTMSHEYGTTLAALGYAVGKSVPGAVCFTYGVGALNATNAIAQAYVERIPLVVLSGAPGKREREAPVFLHHTVVDGDTQMRIMGEITAHQVRIGDPHSALAQLRTALATAVAQSRPVYIEIPRDLYTVPITYVPPRAIEPNSCGAYQGEALDAAHAALELIHCSRQPVLVPGLEVKRFGLAEWTVKIIDALGLPWVATPMSREAVSRRHPAYRGIYADSASPLQATRDLIADCDLLLLLGEPNADVNMGIATAIPDGRLIHCYDGHVRVGRRDFAVSTAGFVQALAETAQPRDGLPLDLRREGKPLLFTGHQSSHGGREAELTPDAMIEELNRHFAAHPDTMLVVDCGDAFFMSLGMSPRDVLTSSLYMSMGIAVPGGIGYQLGSGRRPLVLVGDGAFHMTGQELMHAQKFGASPIVIVLNNQCWASLSSDASDVLLTRQLPLRFEVLAQAYGIRATTAKTTAQLREQLTDALSVDEPVLIDAQVAPLQRSYLCERFFDAIKRQRHLPRL